MKALILVCALAAAALAAPTSKRTTRLDPTLAPQVQAAEQAWSAAEAERDAAKQRELWERAALAFDAVDGAPVEAKVKREAAYAAILAWKNAASPTAPKARHDDKPAPRPLPAREQKLVAALGRYVAYADAADPELPGVLFAEAETYRRSDQLDVAIPKLRAIVAGYPRHEVGEYAANLVLDSYKRLQQYDELVAFADQLAQDAAFLRGRADLARTVSTILRQRTRKRAEALERAARGTRDWEKYVAAATVYLELYNADREAPDNDEVLYNAGVIYEEGRAIAQAISMYTLLEKYYPNSRLTPRATTRLARLYGDIAYFDKAADKLEQYATRYAGEQDAYATLSAAVYYRTAIGDRAKAIASTKRFIKMFGTKRVAEAANASWSLTALFEPDAEATIAHLREYLRLFGDKGGRDRVVIAHAKVGAALWKQSCPHALVDGLCVKVKAQARTCGAGTARTASATRRVPEKHRLALAELALAVKAYEQQGGRFDDPAARYYYAQAKLAQADAELEAYLAGARPAAQTFAAWLDARRDAGGAVIKAYDAVVAIGDPATTISALARRATVAQSLAAELVTRALPRDASCDVVTAAAAPLEALAVEGFAVCLAKSTELSWFEASSASCEQQLAELRPAEFPPMRERRVPPHFAAPVLALEPPLR